MYKSWRPTPRRKLLPALAILCIALAFLGVVIFGFIRADSNPTLPSGSTWGNVPVGGLTLGAARMRVEAVFSTPIELKYMEQAIQVTPQQLGFTLNAPAMVEQASRVSRPGVWQRLWNQGGADASVDLDYTINGEVLRAYLANEVVPRYDQPPQPPMPIPGTTNFSLGTAGRQLDVQQSATLISTALTDPVNRTVQLIVQEESVPPGNLDDLQTFLKQTLAASGFNGVSEVYLASPQTGDILHFAINHNVDIPADIAYSAASTIKIPIMVSTLRRAGDPIPEGVAVLIERMIVLSENPPADTLMENVIGSTLAPLEVTRDIQELLGLKNTFLVGYFYFGAPLLDIFQTPANSRTDVNLDPDVYNQTTTSDMGTLLTAIYNCAANQPSLLTDVFPGEITQAKCSYMLDVLARNEIGVLSEAGVPDGTRVAHKHGWTEEADGFLHTVSDAGIVFSPGADFVFVVFMYDSNQLLFDPADAVIARLVQVMYNYYNPLTQETWLGGPVTFPNQ